MPNGKRKALYNENGVWYSSPQASEEKTAVNLSKKGKSYAEN
jgi:hypothetical protein